jgi:plastocyanin
MRKPWIAIAVAIGAIALVPVLGGVASSASQATITLRDDFFKPSTKTVKRGTKVRFKWAGTRSHNVTKSKGPGPRFRSRTTQARGVNFAKRFTRAGTYRLVCTIHPATMRMRLRVVR